MSETEVIKLRAKAYSDFDILRIEIEKFAKGEKGANYSRLIETEIFPHITEIWNYFHTMPLNGKAFAHFDQLREKIVRGILKIPVDVQSQIFEANTPLQTYRFLKALFGGAANRIEICDRYLDNSVFYRYLIDSQDTVKVTLVTLPCPTQRKDVIRYAAFKDASKLFAEDRTAARYTYKISLNFHDRWVRCDDALFALGGSLKQLDQHFTVARLDYSARNVKHFEDNINNATEVFGPTQPIHQ